MMRFIRSFIFQHNIAQITKEVFIFTKYRKCTSGTKVEQKRPKKFQIIQRRLLITPSIFLFYNIYNFVI